MFRRPTYKAFIGLLDNYSAETGVEEVVTNEERAEVKQFLKAVMETKPLQYCHKYLCAKQSDIPSDRAGFVQLLHKIWFELYRREESRDSSGFEHVFVGEIKVGSLIIWSLCVPHVALCTLMLRHLCLLLGRMARFLVSTTGSAFIWRRRLEMLTTVAISSPVDRMKPGRTMMTSF